ncbi:MAG: hypothetical protein HeimC3_16800 [Candidatus Heimdallarchaeota archaeon LC_3]|nr:MAG: hypothetical protein HeimC3_16800 [Candidatus Heimdallarchaeota archaeon LC_3]
MTGLSKFSLEQSLQQLLEKESLFAVKYLETLDEIIKEIIDGYFKSRFFFSTYKNYNKANKKFKIQFLKDVCNINSKFNDQDDYTNYDQNEKDFDRFDLRDFLSNNSKLPV